MPNEVELKLRIAAADVPRLRHHPAITGITVGKPITRKLTSIYYDTPPLALLDAGLSLRVRRMSGGWFQAVKGAGHSLAGLHQRMEWEDIIARGEPDFSKITDPALTRIFDEPALRAALRPIFTTDVRRTEWQLEPTDGSQVEMALDLGELIVGDSREAISEVELELKQGEPARLFELALALLDDIPLWIENVSKAQRGYACYRPQPPRIFKAGAIRLRPSMQTAESCKKILWECLAQLQGNHDMVMHGSDPEGVHQMRVALRRMRSAMAVFRGVVAENTALLEELRWITATLGQARDLDVFLSETLPPVLEQLEHPGLNRLQEKARQAQQTAYAELRTALDSQRYQRLLLKLGIWLESAPSHSASAPLTKLAHATLQERHRQLFRHGKKLRTMAPAERHATRIAAKKLRYAAEFFVSLYPDDKAQRYIRRLTNLQDVLGTLNDIAVTDNLIRSLAGSRPARALDEAQALFTGWNGLRAKRKLAHLEQTWHRFAQAKPFWD